MLQLPLTFSIFTTHKRTKKLPYLPYQSICCVGIVQTYGWTRVNPSSKDHHHGVVGRRSSGTGLMFWAVSPPENPAGGVAKGEFKRFNIILLNGQEKIFTKLSKFILVFYLLFNFQCPQNNGIVLPPCLLLLTPPLHTHLGGAVWYSWLEDCF